MKKSIKVMGLITILLLMTGCSKLYTYDRVIRESKSKIANDIVIENPGNINRSNGLQAYTAYLERDKYKKITVINGQDYLLPVGQNYLCTDFADVYLVPKFNEFKNSNRLDYSVLYKMNVESVTSSLHPRCRDLKITIDCSEKDRYLDIINRFKDYLNEDGLHLNETGVNRYDIYCENGQKYYKK